MAKKKPPEETGTRALEVLVAAGVDHRVVHYQHSPQARTFGEEAIAQIDLAPGQMFKTLLVNCDDGSEYVVAVVPLDRHLSLKAIAKAAGYKSAQMASPATAQRRSGYVVGGISPLGQTTRHRTFVDDTALDYEVILFSGGKRGLSVEVSPLDLIELTEAELVDLKAQD